MTDDLIGRAEAQTAIQFAAKRYTVAHEAHGEGQVVWSDNLINVTDAMNVLRDLPSAQSEQQWVPCSERLPENGRQVLVFARSVHFALAKYDEMREADGTYKMQWVTFDAWKPFYKIKDVIAWMPLPEYYQEKDGEQE